jgi:hypothetical protein
MGWGHRATGLFWSVSGHNFFIFFFTFIWLHLPSAAFSSLHFMAWIKPEKEG